MKLRMRILLVAMALCASASTWALDLRDGRMLLSLDERGGRFSIHYLADAARNRYISLLSEQDARTSYATLSWNGKAIKLGEGPDFRLTARKEGSVAILEYRSSFALVRQSFSFLRSKGSTDSDGLLVEFAIENLSSAPAVVGLRLLLDTYQGEQTRRHFEIDGAGIVGAETSLAGSSVPSRLLTPGESGVSLQVQLTGDGITRPSRLVLANWRRINDSEWSFEPARGRSFTLLPYSIDDSAAALYFDPAELRNGATLLIRTALGNRTDTAFSAPPIPAQTAGTSQPVPSTGTLPVKPDPFVGARTDLAALRDILARIDSLLASGKPADPGQLEELRNLLDQIRARSKGY